LIDLRTRDKDDKARAVFLPRAKYNTDCVTKVRGADDVIPRGILLFGICRTIVRQTTAKTARARPFFFDDAGLRLGGGGGGGSEQYAYDSRDVIISRRE